MTTRKEIISTLVLLLLGAGYLAYSTEYPMGTWNSPGPRVFPLFVGGILVLLAFGRFVQSLQFRKREEREEDDQLTKKPLRASRPLFLAGVFIMYILMIKGAGFFVSTVAFVVVSSRLIGAKDWVRPFVLALGVVFFCYLLFEVWLKLSLPRGLLF
jgi:putative tricarboxylic transport membrane protein